MKNRFISARDFSAQTPSGPIPKPLDVKVQNSKFKNLRSPAQSRLVVPGPAKSSLPSPTSMPPTKYCSLLGKGVGDDPFIDFSSQRILICWLP